MTVLQSIHRYPVKGFPGEQLSSIELTVGQGLPDDRRYAITNGISNTLDGAWLTCRSFFINAVNDGLLKFANESDSDLVTLASPNGMRLTWRKGDPQSLAFANRKMAEFIAPLLPAHDLPTPQITERNQLPGMLSGYWDFTDSAVSIMNRASLEAVAGAMGQHLDIRRLRGNLIVDELPAWEEFGWLGKRIRIGRNGPELEIIRPAQRCPATAVNPETGDRDLKVPDAMNDHFGHAFCGQYAKVVKTGAIRPGDTLEIIGDAKTPLNEAALPSAPDYRLWPKMAEVVEATPFPQLENGKRTPAEKRSLSLVASGPWPLPEANPGQRMRFHISRDLIGVATVTGHENSVTQVETGPSPTNDPATGHLLEKVKLGERLIVTGPFGRG